MTSLLERKSQAVSVFNLDPRPTNDGTGILTRLGASAGKRKPSSFLSKFFYPHSNSSTTKLDVCVDCYHRLPPRVSRLVSRTRTDADPDPGVRIEVARRHGLVALGPQQGRTRGGHDARECQHSLASLVIGRVSSETTDNGTGEEGAAERMGMSPGPPIKLYLLCLPPSVSPSTSAATVMTICN